MTHYYVYYKVDLAQVAALAPVVAELFDAVKKETGIAGTWLHRRDEPSTYMEVYEGVRDDAAFEALLVRECERLGFQKFLKPGGGRRAECFVCA